MPPGACGRGAGTQLAGTRSRHCGSRDAPHGKLCANCPLTWVVARFGSFNFMFYQYLVPFHRRAPAAPRRKSRQRCLKMMMRPRADSYSGCQETRTYVRRSATYESRVGASRSVHTF